MITQLWFAVFDYTMFLGLPIPEDYSGVLEQVDPLLVQAFISDFPGEYLTRINHEGVVYLGKYVDANPTLSELDLLETNILSILKRLTPGYCFNLLNMTLVTVPTPQSADNG